MPRSGIKVSRFADRRPWTSPAGRQLTRYAAVAFALVVITVSGCASHSVFSAGGSGLPTGGSGGGPGYTGPTGVSCPSLWVQAPLLLPCSDVPGNLVTDPTMDGQDATWDTAQPSVAQSGCTQAAGEGEAFETVSAGDLDAASLIAAAESGAKSSGYVPSAGNAGSGEILLSGANWCLSPATARAALRGITPFGQASKPVSGPAIGQQSSWYMQDSLDGLRVTSVSWIEGPVLAQIMLAGPAGVSTTSVVAGFASQQDARIRLAGNRPPSPLSYKPSTAATGCPPAWAAAPLIPCAQIPRGLVPDPGAARGFLSQFQSSYQNLPACAATDIVAYDTGAQISDSFPTVLLVDMAEDCGAAADQAYKQLTTGGTGPLASAGIGTASVVAPITSGSNGTTPDGQAVYWVHNGWIGLIFDLNTAASAALVEGMARAQNVRF